MFSSIDTPRLVVNRLCDADAPALAAYRNEPEVARYQSWEHIAIAEAQAHVATQNGLEPGTPGIWFQFAVRLKPHQELIGDCGLCPDADVPRLAEIGFTFGGKHQGMGFAQEAVAAVLSYAFEVLHLHRVKAVVDCRNQRALRLLERLGMRREGHFVQHAWFKGAWCDEYVYAVLASDWPHSPCDPFST